MINVFFNIYLVSLFVYFLTAACVTWLDKGISVKHAIVFAIVGFVPLLNIVYNLVFLHVVIKDNDKFENFLNSKIFTRK
jgi:hypothetical protein